jgi:hypothetical protein
MRYKRFSRVSWTFSIPKVRRFFKESDFFNSHACLQQLLPVWPSSSHKFTQREPYLGIADELRVALGI